jgi:DNA primase
VDFFERVSEDRSYCEDQLESARFLTTKAKRYERVSERVSDAVGEFAVRYVSHLR